MIPFSLLLDIMLPSLQAPSFIHSTFILVCLHYHNNVAQTSMEGVAYKQQAFHLFLAVLEAGKSKIKVGPDLMSDEGQLPGSQTVIFSLCPLVAKAIKGLPGASFIRTLISLMRAPPMRPDYFPKPPPPGC